MNLSKQQLTLIVGDLLVIFAVIGVGRVSHAQTIWDVGDWLFVAAPFMAGWLLVMPWLAVYQPQVSQNWLAMLWRVLFGWGVVGCGLALMGRSLLEGRPIIAGIVPIFAAVMVVTTTVSLLAWRLGYAWWSSRQVASTSPS